MALIFFNRVILTIFSIIILLSCRVSNQVNNFNNIKVFNDTLDVKEKGLVVFELMNTDSVSYSFEHYNKREIFKYGNIFIHKNSDRPIGVPMIDSRRIHTIVNNKDTMIIKQQCGIGINLYFKTEFMKGIYKLDINSDIYTEKFITGNQISSNEDLKRLYIKNTVNPNLENNYSDAILNRYFKNLSFRLIELKNDGVTLVKEVD